MLKIYVASLSDYNAGRLHGVWIDCEDLDSDEILEEIEAMLSESPEPYAEEWAIHDFESPIPIGEYASIEEIVLISDLIKAYGEDAVSAAAICYSSNVADMDSLLLNGFTVWEDWDDIIDGWIECMEVPERLQFYIDEEAVRRDLEIEGTYIELENGSIVEFYN